MKTTEDFRAARERLLEPRTNDDPARTEFRRPRFAEFNFAFDWLDADAADPARGTAPQR